MLNLLDQTRTRLKSSEKFNFIDFASNELDYNSYEDKNQFSQDYEKEMATNILDGSKAFGSEKTIVLVGNYHAKRTSNTFGNSNYELMAKHMPTPETISLNTVFISETSWNCKGVSPADCGSSDTGGRIKADSKIANLGAFTILLNGEELIRDYPWWQKDKDIYDGIAFVGAVSMSPPANKDGRIPRPTK